MSADSSDRPPAPDAELLRRCTRGDASAWREVVDRYRRLVYGIPRAIGLQPADAEEVFQHTFGELHRYLPRMREPARLEAWLVTTAHREAVRLRRMERRRSALAENAAHEWRSSEPPADAAIERVREDERLRREMDRLGTPCRELLAGLFSDPPRPYRMLARELGFAVGSLGPIRARCLHRLRTRLAESGAHASPGPIL